MPCDFNFVTYNIQSYYNGFDSLFLSLNLNPSRPPLHMPIPPHTHTHTQTLTLPHALGSNFPLTENFTQTRRRANNIKQIAFKPSRSTNGTNTNPPKKKLKERYFKLSLWYGASKCGMAATLPPPPPPPPHFFFHTHTHTQTLALPPSLYLCV